MRRPTRNPLQPKVVIPVLYVPAAVEAFERAIGGQEPEYGDELVDGYIGAKVAQDRPGFWSNMRKLHEQGAVWLPESSLRSIIKGA